MTSASNPYLTLLRSNRDYRNLFSALVVSLLGDWLNLIAVFVLLGEICLLYTSDSADDLGRVGRGGGGGGR